LSDCEEGYDRGGALSLLVKALLTIVLVLISQAEIRAEENKRDIRVSSWAGTQITITPKPCFLKSTGTYFSMRGEWDFSGDSAQLVCKGKNLDLLSIRNGDKKPVAEYLLNRGHVLVKSENGFDFYEHYPAGKRDGRVLSFVGKDGRRVYVRNLINFPYNYTVFRQLDDHFEITYGIHNLTPSPSDFREYDQQILLFVDSIVRRVQ
jgi:hypothetical protein